MTLPAFYYKTTIACLDDDLLFLDAVTQIALKNYKTIKFTTPNDFIEFWDNQKNNREIPFLRSCFENEHNDTTKHSFVDLDVTSLHLLSRKPNLTEELSILIIDYNLPQMNGIEFLKTHFSSAFKKILLTGEADYEMAVSAFNQNVIDRFIRKDDPNLSLKITTAIEELQAQYFCEKTKPLLSHLEADQPSPLSDPAFAEVFLAWCKANKISEYYLISKTGSFRLIAEDNTIYHLVVHTDKSLDDFLLLNDDVDDSVSHLLKSVKSREKIPFFGVDKESWDVEEGGWGDCFFDARVISGKQKYFWAVT